jgi:uncharacterized glyoxalase superfamily protein PhnB
VSRTFERFLLCKKKEDPADEKKRVRLRRRRSRALEHFQGDTSARGGEECGRTHYSVRRFHYYENPRTAGTLAAALEDPLLRYNATMTKNRSLPTDTVLPHVMYQDLARAIEWLGKAFGFEEHYRYGEPLSGAQVHLGNAWIMLKQAQEGSASPAQLGYGTQSLTVFVDDVEAHFRRAKAEGARILEEPHETVYGEFQYAAQDLDGHHWLFSRHAKDLSPEEWGATVADGVPRRGV